MLGLWRPPWPQPGHSTPAALGQCKNQIAEKLLSSADPEGSTEEHRSWADPEEGGRKLASLRHKQRDIIGFLCSPRRGPFLGLLLLH